MDGTILNLYVLASSDQLIKRRGKAGLLKLNCDWEAGKQWIKERAGKPVNVEGTVGRLSKFVCNEPHDTKTSC